MNSGVKEQTREVGFPSEQEKIKEKKRKISLGVYQVMIKLIGILPARAMLFPGVAPFGVALLAMERRFSLSAGISGVIAALGYISLWDMEIGIRYISAIVLYLIFLFAAGRDDMDISTPAAVSAAGIAVVVSGIGYMIWNGFSAGGVIGLLCDVALVCGGAVVFEKNRGVLQGKKSMLYTMNGEQKLCFGILAAIVLLGFKSIEIYGFLSGANVVSLWLIAVIALSGGVAEATVCALLAGVISGAGNNILVTAAVYGLCAVAGGIAAKRSKLGATLAMAVCAAAVILIGGDETLLLFGYTDIPLFVIAVISTPDHRIRAIGRIMGFGKTGTDDSRCREYMQSRLDSAAASFRTLADTFLDLTDEKAEPDMEDVSALFDGVADRVCRECTRMGECWVNNFNSTYRSMFRMLEAAERRGELSESDADEYFSRKCLRLRGVVREMNRLFEIYKINCVWKSKLRENRELAGQQLADMAQILDDISLELCEDSPDPGAEEEIRVRLEAKGVEIGSIDVTVNPKGRYSAYIEITERDSLSESRRLAESALRSVLGVRMSAVGAVDTRSGIKVRFAQPEGYMVESGTASIGKCEECGDNCVMRYLSGGKYAAALSDGMGTGHRASRDSGATVKLLGDFLEAGFDKSTAVRLVNSIMVMKSVDEAFATVDMCVIDLYGGDAEFVKNGAEPSYIKRENYVETVRAASLPVGVMQDMEIESFAHRLSDGDVVVMMSDGLQMKKGHEDWIRRMVEEADANMPSQELADRIIDMARTLHGGEPEDDMTVMVMKLTER